MEYLFNLIMINQLGLEVISIYFTPIEQSVPIKSTKVGRDLVAG
jgi:hypothetical protein